ncbi:hypothetical protein Lal_00029926 [Lupinus albus]|nr:hypothetical protein Lal_00029926 [Lupinus albus]
MVMVILLNTWIIYLLNTCVLFEIQLGMSLTTISSLKTKLSVGFSPRQHLSTKRVKYMLGGYEVVDLLPEREHNAQATIPKL